MSVTTRLAGPEDAAAIARIYNQGIEERVATFETEPRSPEDIRAQLASKGERYPTVVVERDGVVVAWASAGAYRGRPAYAGVAEQKAGQAERGRRTFERLIAHCRRLQQQRSGEPLPAPDWQTANFTARALARLGREAPEPPRLAGDDTTFFVQSARLHAVQGRREAALGELAQGLALGHGEHRHILDDPDFESLRGEAEFQRLLAGH